MSTMEHKLLGRNVTNATTKNKLKKLQVLLLLLMFLFSIISQHTSVFSSFVATNNDGMSKQSSNHLPQVQGAVSKHIVVAHCKENLDWLGKLWR